MTDVEMATEPQNGEPMDQSGVTDNEIYKQCVAKKIAPELAKEVVGLVQSLGLTNEEFDERAVEQLASFPIDQGRFIIKELKDSQLYGVQNKPQYLMSVMRNLKDRVRQMGAQQAVALPLIPSPPIESIKSIIDRTGYLLEVTVGQRKFHAPPSSGLTDPTHGHEVYVGNLPKDLFEDQLIPLFEPIGTIYDLRLMMDPIYGKNRGYAFLLYSESGSASEAAKKYDGHEIQGSKLKVNVSVANKRLFGKYNKNFDHASFGSTTASVGLGSIPKSKSREEILEDLKKQPELEGVVDVIIYSSPDMPENRKNRGFCFVDFQDHKTASDAKRRLQNGKVRPWNGDLVVDWAESQDEPDEETMSSVKVLYVKNLKESVTEEKLKELFGAFGEIEKIKKLRDYAFIHYKERDPCMKAIESMNGTTIDDIEVDVSLAKPQSTEKSKKRVTTKTRGFGGPGGPKNFGGPGPQRGRGGGFGGPFGKAPYQGGYEAGGYAPYGNYQTPQNYYDPYAYPAYPDPYAQGGYGGGPGYGYGAPAGGFGGGARGGAFNRGGRGNMRGNKRRGESAGGGPTPKRGGRPY